MSKLVMAGKSMRYIPSVVTKRDKTPIKGVMRQ